MTTDSQVKESDRVLSNRYQLLEPIGSGGMGVVYRALDRATDDVVALKSVLVRSDQLAFQSRSGQPLHTSEGELALMQEFRILATLRHPNIISVLDYGFGEDRTPFFTMSYLENPRNIVDVAQDVSFEDKIDLLIQMLEALAYLHQQRVLHRDIKPDNVLVVDNQVQLVDFGLAVNINYLHETGDAVGTVAYMPPEVLNSERATPPTDLYGVGLIAYEMFAGHPAFKSKSFPVLVRDILLEVPDVSDLPVSEDVSSLIARLLLKEQALRPQHASDVIYDLSVFTPTHHFVEKPKVRESYLQAARFVGREDELAQFTSALDDLSEGQGNVYFVAGESGVGKSRFIEEVRVRALVRNYVVLRGQGVEDGGLPFQYWRAPLRHLVLMSSLSDQEAAVLRQILPDIDRLLQRTIPDPPLLEGDAAHQRLVSVMLDVFRRQNRPIVLILEDLHWAGESLEPLRQLSSGVETLPLLIIGSYRRDERPDLPNQLPDAQTVLLNRLDDDEIAQLSVSILGKETGDNPQLVARLKQETEGNVFFLIEVVRALAEHAGSLREVGVVPMPDDVLTGGIQALVRRRLRRVPVSARELLHLSAVIGSSVDETLLKAVEPHVNLQNWITDVTHAGVFEATGDGARFAHDKLRAAVLEMMPDHERRDLHQRVAEAIEKTYPDEKSYAAVLYKHWSETNNQDKQRHYALQAGRLNKELSEFEAARLLFVRAHDLSEPGSIARCRVCVELGQVHWYLGNYSEAHDFLNKALTAARRHRDRSAEADSLFWLSQLSATQGDFETVRILLVEALAASRPSDRAARARIYYGLGDASWRMHDLNQARIYIQHSLKLAQEIENPTQILYAINRLGAIAFTEGDLDEAERQHIENRDLALKMGNLERLASAFVNLGEIARLRGQFDVAAENYEQSLKIARDIRQPQMEVLVLTNLGLLALEQDDLDQARTRLRGVLSLSSTHQSVTNALYAVMGLAEVHSREGRYRYAAELMGLVMNHPTVDVNLQNDIKPFYKRLYRQMGDTAFRFAFFRGRDRDLQQTIFELLAD